MGTGSVEGWRGSGEPYGRRCLSPFSGGAPGARDVFRWTIGGRCPPYGSWGPWKKGTGTELVSTIAGQRRPWLGASPHFPLHTYKTCRDHEGRPRHMFRFRMINVDHTTLLRPGMATGYSPLSLGLTGASLSRLISSRPGARTTSEAMAWSQVISLPDSAAMRPRMPTIAA